MPGPFTLTAAELVGSFCETLFYGMYLVSCLFCARTLLTTGNGNDERWVRWHEFRWSMAIVALTLFAILTLDTVLALFHNYQAFVLSSNPGAEFMDIANWISVARSIIRAIVIPLGDFILVYRCWIIYGRRWPVIVPSLVLYFSSVGLGLRLIQVAADPRINQDTELSTQTARPLIIAFFATTAGQNLLTTSILVHHIWHVEHEAAGSGSQKSSLGQPRNLRKLVRVVVESGTAYTACVVATLAVYAARKNGLYPTANITSQATGILFNVILVRCSFRRDQLFSVFDQNERTTFTHSTQRSITADTLRGSLSGGILGNKPQEVELMDIRHKHDTAKPFHNDIYPTGIMVTREVQVTS